MAFRTCGRFPFNFHSYGYGRTTDKIANFLAQVKAFRKDGTQRAKSALSIFEQKHAPVYDIPLGCYACEDVKYIPILERSNDLYFAGSIQHKKNVFLPRPKELARKRMYDALLVIKMHNEKIKVTINFTSSFAESIAKENKRYLADMMNTKICPIPRGANLDTFRFYEAIRYGCIPVGEAFPKSDFYNAAPIIRLQDWAQLPNVMSKLLSDHERLINLHQKSLAWWKSACSEEATAALILSKINEHFSV